MGSQPHEHSSLADDDGSVGALSSPGVQEPGGNSGTAGDDGQGRHATGTNRRRSAPGGEPEADPEAVARTIVLRQLTGSAKSRKQLADKLAERDVPDDAAVRVLDRFEELQLIDDVAFAGSWVRGRARTRGLSRSALRRELRDKGISDETADEALEQVSDANELDMARELVEKRMRSMPADLDHDKGVRRLVSMLGRKGYGPGVAFRVVNEVWPAERG